MLKACDKPTGLTVLQSLSLSEVLGSDNCFDFEFLLPFNQVMGQFGIVEAIDLVLLIGYELTSVEDIVNVLLAIGQFQLEVDGSNGVSNFKWSKALGSQFL